MEIGCLLKSFNVIRRRIVRHSDRLRTTLSSEKCNKIEHLMPFCHSPFVFKQATRQGPLPTDHTAHTHACADHEGHSVGVGPISDIKSRKKQPHAARTDSGRRGQHKTGAKNRINLQDFPPYFAGKTSHLLTIICILG